MQAKYLICVILPFFLLQCKPSDNAIIPKFSTGLVNICGKVKNYKKSVNSEQVKIAVNDLATNEQHIFESKIIDEKFSIDITLDHPQEFFFYYGNELLKMFAAPGDTLKMELEYADFFDDKKNYPNIVFSKDASGVNNILVDYLPKFHTAFFNKNDAENRKKYALSFYENSRLETMEKQLDFLSNYIKENKLKNNTFKKWAENTIRYNAGKDVLSKALLSKKEIHTYDVGKLLSEINLNDNFAIITAAYDYFLQYYQMFVLESKSENNKGITKLLGSDQLSTGVDNIVEKTTGLAREISLSKYYYDHIGKGQNPFPESLMQSFGSLVTNPIYKNKIQEKYKVLYQEGEVQLDGDIVINNVTNSVEKILPYLLKRHKGKVVYMDIWATWCQPCLKEMVIYPKLHKQLGEDIQYIFLATDSPPSLWYKKIKKLKLKGEHYLLTKDQYLELQHKFYIDGIPHYALVNKQGKIVDDMAPRPSIHEGKSINPKLLESIKPLL